MENKRKKSDIAVVIVALVTAILVFVTSYFVFDYFHLFHNWSAQNVDGTNVYVCSKCGKVKELECIHRWEAQKVGDEFVAYCTKCGESAE